VGAIDNAYPDVSICPPSDAFNVPVTCVVPEFPPFKIISPCWPVLAVVASIVPDMLMTLSNTAAAALAVISTLPPVALINPELETLPFAMGALDPKLINWSPFKSKTKDVPVDKETVPK